MADTALEQQHAQVLFKPFDMPADGAVADMQFLGRQAETLVASRNDKGADSVQGRE
ncbi:hypothetical protein D3C76_1699890 [compost metagenome]